jgi:eukaryotic-like serine/threonine-protein kinase
MGTVWLANRADGRFEGQAAVKILNLGLLTPTGQERLRREGSVLARLTHPGIARLLDAGVSGAGQPYLVLEYVDGKPIDQYIQHRRLAPDQCIRLFLQVLAAVGHAHANLIIHRDLKPSNILVTEEGVVKLLDFGIAKLVDSESGNGSALTIDGGRVFTPQYAAPEQVRGESLTTATDVYALGVMFYILISGHHPTNEGCRTPAESIRAILETEPARLGLGDLDNILDKALQKQPGARYQTVSGLAADLERYLNHEPVSARPHSLRYRVAKFTRRNRTTVTAGVITAVGLIAATIFSVSQMRQAQLQRDDARVQRDRAVYQERRAAASSGFMELLLQSIAPTGKAYTMQEMLDEARKLLETDYRGDPRFMARMLVELADHYFELHDRTRELSLLARAEELATKSNEPGTAALARCRMAKTAADDGAAKDAERHLERASGYLARLHPAPLAPAVQCLRARATLARLTGKTALALVYARQAVALGEAAGDTISFHHLEAQNEVARALHDDGQIRSSLELTQRLIGKLEALNRGRTLTAMIERYNEAALLSRLGEKVAAESTLRRTIRIASGMNPQERVPTYVTLLVGELAADLHHPDSAIATFRRTLSESRARNDTAFQVRSLSGLGDALLQRGRVRQAQQCLDMIALVVPDNHRWRASLLEARLRFARGQRAEGRQQFMAVLAARGYPHRGISTPYFSNLVLDAAIMAWNTGDRLAADSLAEGAIRIAYSEGQDDARSGVIGYARVLQGQVKQTSGDSTGALQAFRAGIGGLVTGYGAGHPRTREAQALLDALGAPHVRLVPPVPFTIPAALGAAAAEPFASPAAPSVPRPPAARLPRRT